MNQDLESGEDAAKSVEKSMPEKKSWRFAYEALTHVHSLRLFLFKRQISLPLRCVSLRAYLLPTSPFSSSPVVVCEWETPECEAHTVYVPMPFCLIDHSAPFSAIACDDHIEVKLKLLPFGSSFLDGLSFLGFSHRGIPIKRDEGPTAESDEAPFSLASDAKVLALRPALSIYCKNCSAKLTGQPLSRFRELPSSDWRELSDHWFGTCCCGNAARTAASLSRFEQLLTPAKGLCLVGSTTCIVHNDDLVRGTEDEEQPILVGEETASRATAEVVDKIHEDTLKMVSEISDASTCGSTLTTLEAEDDEVLSEIDPRAPTSSAVTMVGSEDGGNQNTSKLVQCGTGCAAHHGEVIGGGDLDQRSGEHVAETKTRPSGFMSGPWAAASCWSWTPFNCHACSCLVGVSSGSEGGVQLFKCHISTDPSSGGPLDVFRYHTLERVFCNELLANSEDNCSYRYIIRDLNSKALLLQLVVVNHEAWNCSGSCLGELSSISDGVSARPLKRDRAFPGDDGCMACSPEYELMIGVGKKEFPPAFLEPVMKVMFREVSSLDLDELRAVEDWAREQQADDIYMLKDEVKSLADALQRNQELFPDSSASFQQFHFSFLAR